MREDLAEAQAAGKRFAVVWEQKGCPYCRDLHTINFADPKINKYVRENFVILQLNLWGDREVTDFDGKALPEKEIARKWGVLFTPTVHFFVENSEVKAGKGGREQMAWIMPGYFRKTHFLGSFEYVKNRIYEKQDFQKFIAEKLATESSTTQ
ncbi:MAG: thioredoxin [Proteobacteria bacterium]|nr:MAG: thioredoxin [Pseudomonadota bacterium]QKK12615.1 MAG: thioredoxin fold domain-containing protein [Pseudomonadota bacterium]